MTLDNIIVTDIEPPVIVHSKKGRTFQMENRRTFGLSLCISGQITYKMNSKEYVSEQSNAIILPKGAKYSLYGDKEGIFPVINFTCDNFECTEITVLPLKNQNMCIQSFEALKELFVAKESPLKIYSAFYELLSLISCENSQKNSFMQTIFKVIEDNISDPLLSNQTIAKQVGISEVYLRKLFAKHCTTTPKQYVLDARIKKACAMLIDTPLSICDISENCGFSSVYHFCRSFKQHTGKTPSEYAATNRVYKI